MYHIYNGIDSALPYRKSSARTRILMSPKYWITRTNTCVWLWVYSADVKNHKRICIAPAAGVEIASEKASYHDLSLVRSPERITSVVSIQEAVPANKVIISAKRSYDVVLEIGTAVDRFQNMSMISCSSSVDGINRSTLKVLEKSAITIHINKRSCYKAVDIENTYTLRSIISSFSYPLCNHNR
jgi:hypothetical protein